MTRPRKDGIKRDRQTTSAKQIEELKASMEMLEAQLQKQKDANFALATALWPLLEPLVESCVEEAVEDAMEDLRIERS